MIALIKFLHAAPYEASMSLWSRNLAFKLRNWSCGPLQNSDLQEVSVLSLLEDLKSLEVSPEEILA